MVRLMAKKPEWMKWTAEDVLKKLDIPEVPKAAVLEFIQKNLEDLKKSAPQHVLSGGTPEDYIIGSLENEINDGHVTFEDSEDGEEEQAFIDVSQDEVKQALKSLLTNENGLMSLLYKKHEDYNEQYFGGNLSIPLITIDKLSNRTLGNYTHGKDYMQIENHIRFNRHFIALNTTERVLETLRHEMIHQWQDEIMYVKEDQEPKTVEIPTLVDEKVVYIQVSQKKRPKDWHNKDFRDVAKVVGIPAIGAKCYGNPAKMPEPKSYNRKFICGCVASNGYPVTIWSTRDVFAQCTICKNDFVEVRKTNKEAVTIEVNTSHVEKPNVDAVFEIMKEKYRHFERFDTKAKKDDFIERLKSDEESTVTDMEDGIYQKGHNSYKQGYHYWVAYNTGTSEPAQADVVEPAGEPADDSLDDLLQKLEADSAGTKKNKRAGKGKIVKFPTPDASKEMDTSEDRVIYSANNPQDIIDLYKKLGTTRKVAEYLGVSQPTIMNRKKKYKIDFTAGTYVLPEVPEGE